MDPGLLLQTYKALGSIGSRLTGAAAPDADSASAPAPSQAGPGLMSQQQIDNYQQQPFGFSVAVQPGSGDSGPIYRQLKDKDALLKVAHEGVHTLYDTFQRGLTLSRDKPCLVSVEKGQVELALSGQAPHGWRLTVGNIGNRLPACTESVAGLPPHTIKRGAGRQGGQRLPVAHIRRDPGQDRRHWQRHPPPGPGHGQRPGGEYECAMTVVILMERSGKLSSSSACRCSDHGLQIRGRRDG